MRPTQVSSPINGVNGAGPEAGQAIYDPKEKGSGSIPMPLWWRTHGRSLAAGLLSLLLLTLGVSAGLAGRNQVPKELYSCINDGQPDQQLTTYSDFAFQKPAR